MRYSNSSTYLNQRFLFFLPHSPGPEEDIRVVFHEGVGDVLAVLNHVMQHYKDLQSPDIFAAAHGLLSMIKGELICLLYYERNINTNLDWLLKLN